MELVREPIPGRSRSGRRFTPANRQMAVRGVTSCEWPPCSKRRESVDTGVGAIRRSLALQHGCRSALTCGLSPASLACSDTSRVANPDAMPIVRKPRGTGAGLRLVAFPRAEGAKRPFVRGPRKAVPARLLRPCSHERRLRGPGFVQKVWGSGRSGHVAAAAPRVRCRRFLERTGTATEMVEGRTGGPQVVAGAVPDSAPWDIGPGIVRARAVGQLGGRDASEMV